jgi:hypothetical protein
VGLLLCNFWLFFGLGGYVLGLLLCTLMLLVDRESMFWVCYCVPNGYLVGRADIMWICYCLPMVFIGKGS